jgi:predicted  nucleic acid-binding Zn-ribbon protein
MGQGDAGTEAVSTAGGVRVERSVERKESGVTAEYEVRSLAGSPLRFRVREPIEPATDVKEVGFHPEHEPDEWSLEERAVVFEDVAPPEGAFRTVLGAVVDTGDFLVSDPEVERIVQEADEESEPAAEPESGGMLAGVRARLFGANGTTPAETGADVAAVTVDRSAEAEADGGDADEGVLASVETGLASDGQSDGGAESPEATEGSDAEGAAGAPVSEPAVEAADAETGGSGGEPTDSSETDGAGGGREHAESEDNVQHDEDATQTASGTDTESERDRDPAADLLALVREDETLRAELREALDVEESDGPRGSADVRLRHVQSRVDDLAAYTDALEEAIDEHGRPAEALADLHEETRALRDELADAREGREEIREAVADLRDEVANVRAQQETTRDRVDDLAAATEDVRDDLEDARDRQGSRIDRVEGDVDSVATDVRTVREDLERDLADLRADVADFRELQERLSSAFGAPAAGSQSEDETVEEDWNRDRDGGPESDPAPDAGADADDGIEDAE